tara:strand:+ start:595 stop:1059 length:465 start_codon:yes stop_codon:yes gene_type:complete
MAFKSDNQRKAVFARLNTLNVRANRLPVQIRILVPETVLNTKISAKKFKNRIASEKKFMSKTFGGDTTIKAVGSYIMKRKKKDILIEEKTAIVESSTTKKQFNANRKKFINHIKQKQKQWKQDSVMYKIEGENFIYPKKDYISHDKSKRKILIT